MSAQELSFQVKIVSKLPVTWEQPATVKPLPHSGHPVDRSARSLICHNSATGRYESHSGCSRCCNEIMKPDNPIRLRSFAAEDYENIVDLWRSSGLTIKASDSLSELEKLCAFPPNRFLVAESYDESGPQRILGAVIGAFDGRRAWIYHPAVRTEARRCGIGTLLMREVESHLRAAGASKVNLLVEPENGKAAQFYKCLGYSEGRFLFFSREL